MPYTEPQDHVFAVFTSIIATGKAIRAFEIFEVAYQPGSSGTGVPDLPGI